MNPTADSQVWNQFFFDDGDAALLLHCKIQQTNIQANCLPGPKKTLWANRARTRQRKQRRKQTPSNRGNRGNCLSLDYQIIVSHGTVALVVLWISLVSLSMKQEQNILLVTQGLTCCGFRCFLANETRATSLPDTVERTCREFCTKTQRSRLMTLVGRVVDFAGFLVGATRATILVDSLDLTCCALR